MSTLFILQSQGSSGLINLFFFGGILMVMYFFFIRPQVKKQKEQNKFINNVAKGDEIVTTSGIVGRINKLEGRHFLLQVDQKTFLKVVPQAISQEMTEAYRKAASEE